MDDIIQTETPEDASIAGYAPADANPDEAASERADETTQADAIPTNIRTFDAGMTSDGQRVTDRALVIN